MAKCPADSEAFAGAHEAPAGRSISVEDVAQYGTARAAADPAGDGADRADNQKISRSPHHRADCAAADIARKASHEHSSASPRELRKRSHCFEPMRDCV
ncbi:hypothetical protein KCV01_g1272, partial [Aureobasidium melanogenum]